MTILLISDIHLSEDNPAIATLFLNFLFEEVIHAEALYILGDLFDFWIGDDHKTAFNQIILNALKQITQSGIPIYFMPGNRDFLIGKKFMQQTGCTLLKDPCVIELYNTKVLLTHGDLLCTQDIAYQRFRKFARSWLAQQWFLARPLKKRLAQAKRLRQQSIQQTAQKTSKLIDIDSQAAEKMMIKYNANYLIHGHTHRPDCDFILINNQPAVRAVLGPWHHHGFVLTCQPQKNRSGLLLQQRTIL